MSFTFPEKCGLYGCSTAKQSSIQYSDIRRANIYYQLQFWPWLNPMIHYITATVMTVMEIRTFECLGVEIGLHNWFASLSSSVYLNLARIQIVSWANLSDQLERYFMEDKIRRNMFVGFCWCNSAFRGGCKDDRRMKTRTCVPFISHSKLFQYNILLCISKGLH